MFRAPHWSVRIGYLFVKIDNWANYQTNLIVDSQTKYSTSFSSSSGTQICG